MNFSYFTSPVWTFQQFRINGIRIITELHIPQYAGAFTPVNLCKTISQKGASIYNSGKHGGTVNIHKT